MSVLIHALHTCQLSGKSKKVVSALSMAASSVCESGGENTQPVPVSAGSAQRQMQAVSQLLQPYCACMGSDSC